MNEATPAPRTLYRKLVDSHTVAVLDEQNVLLFCDLHLMNEYTSPQAFTGLSRPAQLWCMRCGSG